MEELLSLIGGREFLETYLGAREFNTTPACPLVFEVLLDLGLIHVLIGIKA